MGEIPGPHLLRQGCIETGLRAKLTFDIRGGGGGGQGGEGEGGEEKRWGEGGRG